MSRNYYVSPDLQRAPISLLVYADAQGVLGCGVYEHRHSKDILIDVIMPVTPEAIAAMKERFARRHHVNLERLVVVAKVPHIPGCQDFKNFRERYARATQKELHYVMGLITQRQNPPETPNSEPERSHSQIGLIPESI